MKALIFTSLVLLFGLPYAAPSVEATVAPRPSNISENRRVKLDEPFSLRIGQRVDIDGTNIKVGLVEVKSDSRCPAGATCVWAGNGCVRLDATFGDRVEAFDLNTSLEPRSKNLSQYKVTLEGLLPRPYRDRAVPSDDYVAHLVVSKGSSNPSH